MAKKLSDIEKEQAGLLISKIRQAAGAFLDIGAAGPMVLQGLCLPASKEVRSEVGRSFKKGRLRVKFTSFGDLEVTGRN